MQLDLRTLPIALRYKVLVSTVTPRPIAWVTTRSLDGVVNAAPYSFFNAMGDDPPLLALGLMKDGQTGGMKDTATNITATGEYVVNLVREADAAKMNLSSVDAPRGVSEIDYAQIETTPSVVVKPPRIATSPVCFECRKLVALDVGPRQTVVLGEVLMAHIADEFILDKEKLYFDTPKMKLIGRTHGSGWYARTSDQFKLERPRYKDKA